MNTLNPKLECLAMFLNEPLLQNGCYENDLGIKDRIRHINLKQEEAPKPNISTISFQPANDISTSEMKNLLLRVDEIEKRVNQCGIDTEKFTEKIDDEIDQVYDEDDAVNKVVEELQAKFRNINGLYENIEEKKNYLNNALHCLDQSKRLTDENEMLRLQLSKVMEEKKSLEGEKPILTKEDLKQLEREVGDLKDQNNILVRKLKEEQNQNKTLNQINESLVAERKTLLSKVHFNKDEQNSIRRDLEEVSQEKMTIERRIFDTNETIDSYKQGRGPLQRIQKQSENLQNEEIKNLMYQNEKLLQELNQLKKLSVGHMSPERIKRGDPKDLYQMNKKTFDLDKENRDRESQVRMLLQQLENEKAINADLNKSFKTLEHRYNQLMNDYNTLKQSKPSNNGSSTFRIFSDINPRNNNILSTVESNIQPQSNEKIFSTPGNLSILSPIAPNNFKSELETSKLFSKYDGKTIGYTLGDIGNKF